jgi:hypothetical protein
MSIHRRALRGIREPGGHPRPSAELELAPLILGRFAPANYTLYVAAVATSVLIAVDLSNPSNLSAEGQRVLFTLAGVVIGVAAMLLANQLQERSAGKAAVAAA